jgi:hypothetical protein
MADVHATRWPTRRSSRILRPVRILVKAAAHPRTRAAPRTRHGPALAALEVAARWRLQARV